METTNPIPIYYESFAYVNTLTINTELASLNSIVSYTLDPIYLTNEDNILYKSEKIKAIISPISMIAGYNQKYPNISDINKMKWYGSDNEITVSLKPYQLNDVVTRYNHYYDRNENDPNWNGLKYKLRYL